MSFGQEEFLAELVGDLGLGAPPRPETYDMASAWIDVFARRALDALERTKPRAGDLVRHSRDPDGVEEISSIGSRGQISLKGGRRPRIPAHRKAPNQREARRPRKPLSSAEASRLEPYRLNATPTQAEIEILETAIDNGPERAVQEVIERYPQLLAGLTQSSWGTFVIPQVSLGGDLFPDFLLAVADSGGVFMIGAYTLYALTSLPWPLQLLGCVQRTSGQGSGLQPGRAQQQPVQPAVQAQVVGDLVGDRVLLGARRRCASCTPTSRRPAAVAAGADDLGLVAAVGHDELRGAAVG